MANDNFLKEAQLCECDLERLSYLLDRFMVWYEGADIDDIENGFRNDLEGLYDFINCIREDLL